MPMDTEKSRLEQVPGFLDVAAGSLTPDMVTDLAEKAVKAVEMLDDLLQPEVLSLIQKLPDLSAVLDRMLTYVQKMENSGTLAALVELADFVAIAKSSMTEPMISDTMERAIAGLEWVDDLAQKGVPDLAGRMVAALDEAQEDAGKLEKPLGFFQMAGMMKDPDVRRGLTLLLLFLKKWGASIRKK